MAKRVVIVGAGYAGIEAALSLNKSRTKTEITLIDRNDYHTLLTELHEAAANRIAGDGIIVPLERIFGYTNVKVIKDDIRKFDFEAKTITSEKNEYPYDYLVLAMGSEPNFFGIDHSHAFTLWSYDDAITQSLF